MENEITAFVGIDKCGCAVAGALGRVGNKYGDWLQESLEEFANNGWEIKELPLTEVQSLLSTDCPHNRCWWCRSAIADSKSLCETCAYEMDIWEP